MQAVHWAMTLAAPRQTEVEPQQGALLTIEPGRSRMRLLPLIGTN
jgi:hypothetical protein